MFENVLANPTLSGFTLNRVHTDKANNQRPVEYPDGWECVAWPQNPDDPDEVPASFHRDQGYGLAAGYMKWEGGYVQRGVTLHGGQRYLAKATFKVNMGLVDQSNPPDWQQHIQWRFLFNDQGHQVESAWMTATKPFGQTEECLFVVEAVKNVTLDFGLIFRSIYASTAGEIHVLSIELQTVPTDYGEPVMVGNPDSAAAIVPPPSEKAPDPAPKTPAPVPETPATGGGLAKSLQETLTRDDVTVISAGFRALAENNQFDAAARAAFIRFADALERMKG